MLNDIFNILLPQIALAVFIILQLVLSIIIHPRKYKYARLISTVGIVLSIILLELIEI